MTQNQKNQNKLLKFIHNYIEDNGYPPTVRELRTALGFSSTNHARYLLHKLEDQGLVSIAIRTARGIRITKDGHEKLNQEVEKKLAKAMK